jgi:hypothetical protein
LAIHVDYFIGEVEQQSRYLLEKPCQRGLEPLWKSQQTILIHLTHVHNHFMLADRFKADGNGRAIQLGAHDNSRAVPQQQTRSQQ